jgi:xanthine dehydrogenase YagS FAD-binding subunit
VDDELLAATVTEDTAYKVAMVRNTTTMTLLRLAEEAAR